MAKLNITQAAKATGVARVTIQRHIKRGKLSCEVIGSGQKVIDTSELLRVYGGLKSPDTPDAEAQRDRKVQREAPDTVQMLRQKIEGLEREAEELRKDKEDLRQDKEANRKREEELLTIIKQQQTLLLPQTTGKKGGFWRVFGG